MNLKMTNPTQLRVERISKFNQKEIARKIGISVQHYNNVERARYPLTRQRVETLATIFNKETHELFSPTGYAMPAQNYLKWKEEFKPDTIVYKMDSGLPRFFVILEKRDDRLLVQRLLHKSEQEGELEPVAKYDKKFMPELVYPMDYVNWNGEKIKVAIEPKLQTQIKVEEKMGRKYISTEVKKTIVDEARKGMAPRDLAKKYGVSVSTAYRVSQEAPQTKATNGLTKHENLILEVLAAREKGALSFEVAREMIQLVVRGAE